MIKNIALPTIQGDAYVVYPESVGWYKQGSHRDTFRRGGEFPHFNLHLVTEGRGYVEIDGKPRELKRGDAFLFSPDQEQRYYPSEDDPWEVYFLHFYGGPIKEFLQSKGFYRTNLWTMRQWEGQVRAFDRLIDEAENHKLLYPAALSTLAYGVLAELATQAVPLAPRREMSRASVMLALLPELQERACEPFDLAEWAEKADVSASYFCKLFRKLTGQTPMEFVSLCRIRQAKQMLIEKRAATVAEIASSCGYPSASYFIQRFKKQEGMTPHEYKLNV